MYSMKLDICYKMTNITCGSVLLQTVFQKTWASPSTGTSMSRSTWSLRWWACCCQLSCTAEQEVWFWRATPLNLCWVMTPSSRLWLRRACTSPTRRDWWPRETCRRNPFRWWENLLFLIVFQWSWHSWILDIMHKWQKTQSDFFTSNSGHFQMWLNLLLIWPTTADKPHSWTVDLNWSILWPMLVRQWPLIFIILL